MYKRVLEGLRKKALVKKKINEQKVKVKKRRKEEKKKRKITQLEHD
jgi:hypothetical protein